MGLHGIRVPSSFRQRWNPRRLMVVLSACLGAGACGEPPVDLADFAGSALNRLELSPRAEPDGYRVVIVGHAYGNIRDRESLGPAASLRKHLAAINELKPSFTLLLGDFVRSPKKSFIQALQKRLAKKLESPLFVAPGEHDLVGGPAHYERHFGSRYYYLRKGSELFLILDTGGAGADQTELSPEQQAFVHALLQQAAADAEIRNIVVLIHKVLWVDRERYRGLKPLVNNDRQGGFWRALYPELQHLARSRSVYVGAGDIGHLSYSFVVDRDPEDGITYFATGLADRSWDSVAVMHFLPDGKVEIQPLPLSEHPIDAAATTLEGFARWRADGEALR